MLTVYVDFKSAASYLALKPTLALAERLGLEIDWKPFRTAEREVPPAGPSETVGQRHRRVRMTTQRKTAIKYAAHQGIDLRFPDDPGRTDLALAVLVAIETDPLPFIQVAFDAYWQDKADLNDLATVQGLIDRTGSGLGVALADARERFESVQKVAEAAGIVGAPAYVIDDQIFVGREHLPWIEELARKLMN